MNKSTLKSIKEIIDLDDCPFTVYEIHGFFIGLLVSSHTDELINEKIVKFLDLSKSLATSKLITKVSENINQELSKKTLTIHSLNNNDAPNLDDIANSLSEWTYYFLIGFKGDSLSNTPEIQEILDIFDEISQVNQKYKLDGSNQSSQESLDEINSFIIKSTLYLYSRNLND